MEQFYIQKGSHIWKASKKLYHQTFVMNKTVQFQSTISNCNINHFNDFIAKRSLFIACITSCDISTF